MLEQGGSLHRLCESDGLPDPGTKGFVIERADAEPVRLFIVRKHGQTAAYLNSCPHTGAPLEWLPDQFLDLDNSFIQCAIHGALFRPEDGYCLRGPCVGRSLTALPLTEDAGQLWVTLPAEV
jgi:nitrite reductase/ring-hydroxylating ferredoxin subunit